MALFEKKKKVALKIGGMHCEKCVAKVEAAVKALGGSASVDLKLGRAAVTVPEKLDSGRIVEAVQALGFSCELL